MSLLTSETPSVVTEPLSFEEGGDSDDLVHVACDCSEWVALCGTELNEEADEWTEDEVCVVCRDLEPQPCPRCGGTP